jgi:hypothetical protein
LLNYVRKLMGQHPIASMFGRRILLAPEDDMLAERPGPGVQRVGGTFGVAIGMDLDAREVVPEPRLHERASLRIERLTG